MIVLMYYDLGVVMKIFRLFYDELFEGSQMKDFLINSQNMFVFEFF